ncbi:MAG: ParB N-terminal domain-containing protein [Sphingomonadales bacterium]|nr:ParB N-terminal domain-containing protein [Sphingomonadales bacterium]
MSANDSQLFINELAANIGENGLLQNLVVAPMAKPKGHYCVTAGGRRLRAMNRLVEIGQWPKDVSVDCRSLQGDPAQQSEVSFAENFMQLKMTVTDEIRAFKHFINEGAMLVVCHCPAFGADPPSYRSPVATCRSG